MCWFLIIIIPDHSSLQGCSRSVVYPTEPLADNANAQVSNSGVSGAFRLLLPARGRWWYGCGKVRLYPLCTGLIVVLL